MLKRHFLAWVAPVILLAVVLVFIALRPHSARILQPLNYNHKIHINTVGLGCNDCHLYTSKLASAGIPTLETCQTCHGDKPLSESPEEQKLLTYVAQGKEIPWVRVHEVPDHVYFSHRRHVLLGDLQCDECHGNVAEREEPFTSPVKPITMKNCLKCHREKGVTNDCLACHH